MAEFTFTVQEAGLYDLNLLCYPYGGKGSEIQRAFFLDGKLPYGEMALIELSRVWTNGNFPLSTDASGVAVRAWAKDNQGNDMKPSAVEAPEWQNIAVHDSNGYITSALSLWLEPGTHTLTALSLREPLLIRSFTLKHNQESVPYTEQLTAWNAKDSSGVCIRL